VLDRVTGEGEGGAGVERLRFGTDLTSNVRAVAPYELVTEEVGRRLGLPTELVVETSYKSCEMDLNEVCFVSSLPYVTFERRGLDVTVPVAAPVIMGARYRGRPSISPMSSFTATVRSGRFWTCGGGPGPTTSRCPTRGMGFLKLR
jgi:hypothetical protein